MFKLCCQALLLVAAICAFVISLRDPKKDGPPAVAKTSAVDGAWAKHSFPRQAEEPVKKAATKDQLPARKEAPVTKAEAEALAVAIQAAITSGDTKAFEAQFDFSALGTLILTVIDGSTVEAQQVRATINNQLPRVKSALIDQIFQKEHSGGSYQYLRTVERDDGPRPIFRLLMSGSKLNYHEFVLARRPQGVRVVDLFVYTLGERLSESVQRFFLIALPRDQQTVLASMSGSARASLRRFASAAALSQTFMRGDNQRVLDMFASLPDDLRAEKAIQFLRVAAAQKVSDAEYAVAIDDYRKAFPQDPSIDLISFDSHIMAGRYAELHDALQRLEEQVGGDPYLQGVHADAFVQEGKLEQAEKIAREILAADPRNVDAHWTLVSVSLRSKRFETTAYLLAKLRDELGVPIRDLTQVPEYAEFVASTAFPRWQNSSRR
jgi:tetratricopeptide (TPR) repeat protein